MTSAFEKPLMNRMANWHELARWTLIVVAASDFTRLWMHFRGLKTIFHLEALLQTLLHSGFAWWIVELLKFWCSPSTQDLETDLRFQGEKIDELFLQNIKSFGCKVYSDMHTDTCIQYIDVYWNLDYFLDFLSFRR